MRGYFESDSYNTNEDDKSHDLRTLTIGVDIGGLIVDMSDYSIMNEFGSQRNEQSMRTRVSREKAIELRDALLKIYPIE